MIISILILVVLIFIAIILIGIWNNTKEVPEKLLFMDAQSETIMETLAEILLGIRILLLRKYNINLSDAWKKYQDKMSKILEKEFNDEDFQDEEDAE